MEQYQKDTKKREYDSEIAKDIDNVFRGRYLFSTVWSLYCSQIKKKRYNNIFEKVTKKV